MTEQHNIDYQLDNDFCLYIPLQRQTIDQLRSQLTMLLHSADSGQGDYMERRRKIIQTGDELRRRGSRLEGLLLQ